MVSAYNGESTGKENRKSNGNWVYVRISKMGGPQSRPHNLIVLIMGTLDP